MAVTVRRHKLCPDVNEDEIQNQNQNQENQDVVSPRENDQAKDLRSKFQAVLAKLSDLERKFNSDRQPLLNQKSAVEQQAAKLGIILGDSNESKRYNYSFSKKIFESVQTGKTDELLRIVKAAFINLPDLSYTLDEKGCTSFAKRLLTFLNDKQWNDGENHWAEVSEHIQSVLLKANVSFSTRELRDLINELEKIFRGSSVFAWIFGRVQAVQAPQEKLYTGDNEQTEPVEALSDVNPIEENEDLFAALRD